MDRHVASIFSEAQIRSVSPEMSNFPLLHSTGPMTFGSNKPASGELVTYDAPGGGASCVVSKLLCQFIRAGSGLPAAVNRPNFLIYRADGEGDAAR